MKKLVFASHNSKKIEEAVQIMGGNFEILALTDIGFTDEIIEDADSFEGNARIKAETVFQKTGFACFADDSGLVVPALNGMPGVKSARYAHDYGPVDHGANNRKLLSALESVSERKAYFITVICLKWSADQIFYFEGRIHGEIHTEMKGDKGFGYDPLFIPEGFNQTFAELGASVKNTISHRALALKHMQSFLQQI